MIKRLQAHSKLETLPRCVRVNDQWQQYTKEQKCLAPENRCTRVSDLASGVGEGDPRIDEWLALRTETSASSQDMELFVQQRAERITEELQTQNTRLLAELQSKRKELQGQRAQLQTIEQECLRAKLECATVQSNAADREKTLEAERKELHEKIEALEKNLEQVSHDLEQSRDKLERAATETRIAKVREESTVSATDTKLEVCLDWYSQEISALLSLRPSQSFLRAEELIVRAEDGAAAIILFLPPF